jgi:hypothetical protein
MIVVRFLIPDAEDAKVTQKTQKRKYKKAGCDSAVQDFELIKFCLFSSDFFASFA